jgi:polar amino acid transport system substrate-binding protein
VKSFLTLFFLIITARIAAAPTRPSQSPARTRRHENRLLRVAVAGSEPFVVHKSAGLEGISVEIWQALATQTQWRYHLQLYENVPKALDELASGRVDLVVGPVSITAQRAELARFSQPYFQSSLSILSRTGAPTLWERLAPFFSKPFFVAVTGLLSVLALVGALIWLAERRVPEAHFPHQAGRGIANGIWFAIVTMSTVGYGDLTPKTFLGRLVSGIWIVISVIAATSLVAGIASTLTLTGMRTTVISTAEQLSDKEVAVLMNSPGEVFAKRWGARLRGVESLQEGYTLLKQKSVDAFVFDRPQLLYFLQQRHDSSVAVSNAEYMRQNYGFALPLSSTLMHEINVILLQLEESGRVDRIVRSWLGEAQE